MVSRPISSIRLVLNAELLCQHPMRPVFRVPLVPLERLRLLVPLLLQVVLQPLVLLLNKGMRRAGCSFFAERQEERPRTQGSPEPSILVCANVRFM